MRHPSRTVLIPITGDSMIEAGIHPGDVAVVEREASARPGDQVIAVIDNEFTLKTLAMEDGEAKRDDEHYQYVAAWEFTGDTANPQLHKEPLNFEYVHPATRSYK